MSKKVAIVSYKKIKKCVFNGYENVEVPIGTLLFLDASHTLPKGFLFINDEDYPCKKYGLLSDHYKATKLLKPSAETFNLLKLYAPKKKGKKD